MYSPANRDDGKLISRGGIEIIRKIAFRGKIFRQLKVRRDIHSCVVASPSPAARGKGARAVSIYRIRKSHPSSAPPEIDRSQTFYFSR